MNFLNANRAEHEADIAAVDKVTNPNLSPREIKAALTQLAKTADDRAASLGNQYVGVVGTTYSNLLSANALSTLQDLGIPSRAKAFSGTLPRNPAFVADPSAQTLQPRTDAATVKRFAAACGNDQARTLEMMREHGWLWGGK
jgi:hypothetical protein